MKLVADLKHAGVKLDVVGLQGHLQPQYPHNPDRYEEFLHALSDLGVDIYITEFDVRDDTFPDDPVARDAAVASTARQYLETTLRHPAVKALITWELADNYSFYRGIYRARNPAASRLPRPLPYDDRMQAKPLRDVIAQAFESARRPAVSTDGHTH